MMRLRSFVIAVAVVVSLLGIQAAAEDLYAGTEQDRAALTRTGDAIRAAFARGDLEGIMAYHHPAVIKTLRFDRIFHDREEWKADLSETLAQYHLEFVAHQVESLFFQGDTAVEQSTFTIRGTPLHGGEPFLFRGRSMVVYVRYKPSPTGWASIRELIQPAP